MATFSLQGIPWIAQECCNEMTSSSIMYDNNESYIAVEQPKNLIVWRNILKKAQKKIHIDKNQYPQMVYHESIKKIGWKMGRMPPHPSQIGGDTMQE